jgi:hypothetical protein
MIARLAQIKAAIIAGTIVVPTTPEGAAAFTPVRLTATR